MASKAVKNKSGGSEDAKNQKLTKAANSSKGKGNQPKGVMSTQKPTKMVKKEKLGNTENMVF